MARPEKVAVVDEVRSELADNPATLLTEYRGLSVHELAELRSELRHAGARYVVVKNTLARIAARDAGFEALEELFTGPTALTYCDEDPVGPAKALRRFAKAHPQLVVKGGVLEGRVVDADTADKLADLESREELLQKLAGMMYGALANAASLFQAPLGQMARLIAALEEKGEAPAGVPEAEQPEGEPEAAAEADAEAAAEVTSDEEPSEEASEEDPAEATSEAVEAVADVGAEAVEAAADIASDAAEAVGGATGAEGAAETVADAVASAAATVSDAVSAAGEAAGEVAGDAVEAAAGADEAETTEQDEAETTEQDEAETTEQDEAETTEQDQDDEK